MTQATRNLLLTVTSPGRPPAPGVESSTRIAAIDIGSNSIRMIIADVGANGAIRVVDEMKAAPRLGAGVERTGALSGPAIQNALSALARMAALAKQQGCRRIEVVATSAVREASNRQEFLALVREETGLKIRVINGEDEARFSFRSALAHFDLAAGRSVIMDIGGGSLELVLSADGLVDRFISLPFGAIRLTEEFLTDTNGLKGVRRLRKRVRRELTRQLSARHWGRARIIASGGTFTNLASIHLARQGMDTTRTTHGTVVPRVDLEHIVDTLASMSPNERGLVPGLNKERADIIVAGLAVAAEVLARLEARELVVSAYGIREGILLDAARVTPTIADPGEARERSVNDLAERSHFEAPHAQHVQKLALQIFDAIGPRIGCQPDERQLLADAALLHDIGYHINYEKHHKHTYHLVQHAELLGMTPVEQIVVANVARYHRGALPKRRHENFASLDSTLRAKIVRLSAILRVADGFDRGHAGAVDSVRVRWTRRALRLTAIPNPKAVGIRLELWGAARKSKLLARVADARVEIVAPDGKVVTYEDEDGKAD